MPIFAAEVFGGDAATLGYLMGPAGVGALSAAVHLASRKTIRGLAKVSAFTAGTAGLSLMLSSYSTSLSFSLMMIGFTGFGVMAIAASCNTIMQTIVPDDKRGRMVSFYIMAFLVDAHRSVPSHIPVVGQPPSRGRSSYRRTRDGGEVTGSALGRS